MNRSNKTKGSRELALLTTCHVKMNGDKNNY